MAQCIHGHIYEGIRRRHCPVCQRPYKQKWYLAHRSEEIARRRKWFRDHPINRKNRSISLKAWSQANPDKMNEYWQRRRARRRKALVQPVTKAHLDFLFECQAMSAGPAHPAIATKNAKTEQQYLGLPKSDLG